jgi:hypothetical protein
MKNPEQKPSAIGTPVLVRLQPDQLKAIDAWRRDQENMPSRAEAIRRLAARDLRTEAVRKGTK